MPPPPRITSYNVCYTKLLRYYDPLHPAVLRVLHDVAQTALQHGKGLCLCGEMASDPANLLLLVGMGIREFSMPAPFIPRTKAFLAGLA